MVDVGVLISDERNNEHAMGWKGVIYIYIQPLDRSKKSISLHEIFLL